jgi:hypothetical protein
VSGTSRMQRQAGDRREPLELSESLRDLLEECRMVLPGIQALFGFQLIAVFNEGFSKRLAAWQQQLHLAAIVLVLVAVALVMAPAALHRSAEQGEASDRFLRVASRWLLVAMAPLSLAICLDLFLVTCVICHEVVPAAALAVTVLAGFAMLWFGYPAHYRAERRRSGQRPAGQ